MIARKYSVHHVEVPTYNTEDMPIPSFISLSVIAVMIAASGCVAEIQ
jgi:hypothetical protein